MFNKKKYLGLNKFTYLNINGKYNLDGGSSELLEKEPEICTCRKTDSTANTASSGGGGAAVDINTSIQCICNETYIKNIYDEIKIIYNYLKKIPEVSRQLNEIKSDIEFNETFNLNEIQEILENIQSYFLISTKKENIQGRSGFDLNNDIYQAVIMFCFNLKIYEELPEIPKSSKKEEISEFSQKEELSDWELLDLKSSELKSSESKNQKIITNNSRKFIFHINNDIILQFFLNAYTYLKIKVKVNINDIETTLLQLKEVREQVLDFLEGPYTDFTSDIITRKEAKDAEAEAKANAAHKRKYLKYKNKYLELKRSNKL